MEDLTGLEKGLSRSGWVFKCACGGLIHAAFGDESYDGDYWLYYLCSKCGSTDAASGREENDGNKGN